MPTFRKLRKRGSEFDTPTATKEPGFIGRLVSRIRGEEVEPEVVPTLLTEREEQIETDAAEREAKFITKTQQKATELKTHIQGQNKTLRGVMIALNRLTRALQSCRSDRAVHALARIALTELEEVRIDENVNLKIVAQLDELKNRAENLSSAEQRTLQQTKKFVVDLLKEDLQLQDIEARDPTNPAGGLTTEQLAEKIKLDEGVERITNEIWGVLSQKEKVEGAIGWIARQIGHLIEQVNKSIDYMISELTGTITKEKISKIAKEFARKLSTIQVEEKGLEEALRQNIQKAEEWNREELSLLRVARSTTGSLQAIPMIHTRLREHIGI
jgi:hypothetical protein